MLNFVHFLPIWLGRRHPVSVQRSRGRVHQYHNAAFLPRMTEPCFPFYSSCFRMHDTGRFFRAADFSAHSFFLILGLYENNCMMLKYKYSIDLPSFVSSTSFSLTNPRKFPVNDLLSSSSSLHIFLQVLTELPEVWSVKGRGHYRIVDVKSGRFYQ